MECEARANEFHLNFLYATTRMKRVSSTKMVIFYIQDRSTLGGFSEKQWSKVVV